MGGEGARGRDGEEKGGGREKERKREEREGEIEEDEERERERGWGEKERERDLGEDVAELGQQQQRLHRRLLEQVPEPGHPARRG